MLWAGQAGRDLAGEWPSQLHSDGAGQSGLGVEGREMWLVSGGGQDGMEAQEPMFWLEAWDWGLSWLRWGPAAAPSLGETLCAS